MLRFEQLFIYLYIPGFISYTFIFTTRLGYLGAFEASSKNISMKLSIYMIFE